MKISVIIPTYNRAFFVKEAVESVLKQTWKPEEILVVDDGSKDDTLNVLSGFGEKIRIIRQENKGVSAARNRGLQEARCDWIAFLDSDDMWAPKKLEKQKNALYEQFDYNICYTNEEWRRNGRWVNPGKRHQKYTGWIYEKCLPLCIISPSSVLIHKSVFTKTGVFDESLPACEDYDLWLRMTSSYPVLYLSEKLIVKRAGEWEQLSKLHSLDKYRIIALRKMLDGSDLSLSEIQATREMLRYKCHVYEQGCQKHERLEEIKWVDKVRTLYCEEKK